MACGSEWSFAASRDNRPGSRRCRWGRRRGWGRRRERKGDRHRRWRCRSPATAGEPAHAEGTGDEQQASREHRDHEHNEDDEGEELAAGPVRHGLERQTDKGVPEHQQEDPRNQHDNRNRSPCGAERHPRGGGTARPLRLRGPPPGGSNGAGADHEPDGHGPRRCETDHWVRSSASRHPVLRSLPSRVRRCQRPAGRSGRGRPDGTEVRGGGGSH